MKGKILSGGWLQLPQIDPTERGLIFVYVRRGDIVVVEEDERIYGASVLKTSGGHVIPTRLTALEVVELIQEAIQQEKSIPPIDRELDEEE